MKNETKNVKAATYKHTFMPEFGPIFLDNMGSMALGACCSAQTAYKPVHTSLVKQTTGDKSLLS